jgi:hypothetical protein
MNTKAFLLSACLWAALSAHSQAIIVYQDNFDAGTSGANWTTNLSGADGSASYAFDYSGLGIPSAPNSSGGSTIGMRFLVNQSAGVFQGISASPTGQAITGDFKLNFDMWLNYVGPLGPGGSGTTQLGTFGMGTNGTAAQWPGATNGIMLAASLDGGSAQDYRLYRNNAQDTTLSTYAAGSQNNSATYYTAAFLPQSAPAAQVTLFPGQTGTTDAGEVAFRWMQVEVERAGNILTWKMNNTLIATTDLSTATLAGDNIFFGLADTNATSSTDLNDHLITAIFDNIVVTAVPEPASGGLFLAAVLFFAGRRRRH